MGQAVGRRPLCAHPELAVLLAAAEGWTLHVPEQCASPAFHGVSLTIRRRNGRRPGRLDVHRAGVCVWHAYVLAERHGARLLSAPVAASP
jgi:hypothetical protein